MTWHCRRSWGRSRCVSTPWRRWWSRRLKRMMSWPGSVTTSFPRWRESDAAALTMPSSLCVCVCVCVCVSRFFFSIDVFFQFVFKLGCFRKKLNKVSLKSKKKKKKNHLQICQNCLNKETEVLLGFLSNLDFFASISIVHSLQALTELGYRMQNVVFLWSHLYQSIVLPPSGSI